MKKNTGSSMTNAFRVLFIGNSYTTRNDLLELIKSLAAQEESAAPVETEVIAFGGASLAAHWNRGDAQRALASQRWDAVVLQEQSSRPLRALESMRKHARLFVEAVRQSGARPILYMTWRRQDQPESGSIIAAAYRDLAIETGCGLAAVGEAWIEAEARHPDVSLYEDDKSHPSFAGSLVAARSIFESLFERSAKSREDARISGGAPI